MSSIVAKALLESEAVFVRPDEFFTWTSGIKAPLYCDNRLLISRVNERRSIVEGFVDLIKKQNLSVDVIAGTATAGIPWAAWIAEKINLPMIYVRSSAKDHGRKNAIEGEVKPEQKVLLIEDLISTGKSSIAAVNFLKEANLDVLGVMSLFNYGLPLAKEKFDHEKLNVYSLCTLDHLLDYALESKRLNSKQIDVVKNWRSEVKLP